MTRPPLRSLFLLTIIALAGCGQKKPAVAPKPPEVIVVRPIGEMITDYEEFPGWFQAINSVDVLPRAQGNLTDVYFRDGQEVKEGDLLAVIDSATYAARELSAEAAVGAAAAAVRNARVTYERAKAAGSGASELEKDQDEAALIQAQANLRVAEANLKLAQVNLNYTRIVAPIGGRISYRRIDPGNIVITDTTKITNIVSTDPIYAYFDIDERTVQRLDAWAQETGSARMWKAVDGQKKGQPVASALPQGSNQPPQEGNVGFWSTFLAQAGYPSRKKDAEPVRPRLPVNLALPEEKLGFWTTLLAQAGYPLASDFPHTGTIDFVDNIVNRQTGTLRVRGIFRNPDTLFTSGMYCRIQLPIGLPRTKILIDDKAIGTDQGRKYILIVNAENKVVLCDVKIGSLHNGMRVVEGVGLDERVIVSGLQRVRPGQEVVATEKKTTPHSDGNAPATDVKLNAKPTSASGK